MQLIYIDIQGKISYEFLLSTSHPEGLVSSSALVKSLRVAGALLYQDPTQASIRTTDCSEQCR